MRSVARAVGVEAMSLYNHVAGKDALLDAMIERVVAPVYVPHPAGEWRDELRRRTRSFYEAMTAHRWLPVLLMSHLHIGQALLTQVDRSLACLTAAGFDIETADHVLNAINSYLYGFVLQELTFPVAQSEFASAAAAHRDRVPAERYPRIAELTVLVVEGRYDGINHLAFGLDLLLDRLEELRLELIRSEGDASSGAAGGAPPPRA